VPRIADILSEAARHPHHDRRREPIRRAPAQRSTIVQLLRRWIRILPKLDLGDGHQAGDGHPHGSTNDPLLGEARVEHASLAELPLQPFRDEMDAALPPDVLAEDDALGIHLELATKGPAHRLGETHYFALVARVLSPVERRALLEREATEHCRSIWLLEYEAPHGVGISRWTSARLSQTLIDVALDLGLDLPPRRRGNRAWYEVALQLGKRVASEISGDLVVGAI